MLGLILDAEGVVVAPWRHGVGVWVHAWGHLHELHELWLKARGAQMPGGSLARRGSVSACTTWCRHPKMLGP